MKKILITALTLLFTTTLISQNTMTFEQKVAHSIGHNWGHMMAQSRDHFNFDLETIFQAMRNAFEGNPSPLTPQEMQQAMQQFEQQINEGAQRQANVAVEQNRAAGRAFLEQNRQNEGVIETASGLQYRVVRMGDGPRPAATDRVRVHYEGTLLDGTVFDSSFARNQDITFGLNQVIAGWTEGLQLMPVGSKFVFYIPADLAYGDRGAGQLIGPGATLIFTVELFGINE